MIETTKLLDLSHVRVDLYSARSRAHVTVVDDVTLHVSQGEGLGLVGESGSGKSMTTRAILRLLPAKAKVSGTIEYCSEDVARMNRRRLASYRGPEVGMIFQDPRAHINPLWTIGDFLTEAVVARGEKRFVAEERAISLLNEVGIGDGGRRLRQYPYQLSGGLLQRIMIVAVLMEEPHLLLADEITTALDVTVQSEVMAILDELRVRNRLGLLLITHDLDLAAAVTDRLAVMYAGTIVETAPSAALVATPRHPYTAGLLGSRPHIDEVRRLRAIPGRPISASESGSGCVFAARCAFATDICRTERPLPVEHGDRTVACHRADELADTLKNEAAA